MTGLRKKRLLLLASYPGGDHKRYYSWYCELLSQGLVRWTIGIATLTPAGEQELKRLQGE